MAVKRLELTNKRFGRLLVHTRAKYISKGHTFYWICQCDCGIKKVVSQTALCCGYTKSCGCWHRENGRIQGKRTRTHGESYPPTVEYETWHSIKSRCYDPNDPSYPHYGGRGIRVCKRWFSSYSNFLQDMGRRGSKHSIDRINNDGNYEPRNCRWATWKENNSNRSNSIDK